MRLNADDVMNWSVQSEVEPGKWVASRPINYRYESCIERIKNAWAVLTGRADALFWRKQ